MKYLFVALFFLLSVHIAATADPKPFITATPNHIVNSATVNITWGHVSTPDKGDFIVVLSADDGSWILGQKVQTIPGWKRGFGHTSMDVPNWRHNMLAVYFSPLHNTTYATTNITVVPNQPRQGHLSLTTRTDEMAISWQSISNSTPIVQWGLQSGNYPYSAVATSKTYTKEQFCPPPTYLWPPGYTHTAVMTGLVPNTKYFYRYGTPDLLSDERLFISRKNSSDLVFRIMTFGDLWALSNVYEIMEKDLLANPFDLVLHVGDINYAVGNGKIWDHFFDVIEPMATRVPYLVGVGNHEYDWPEQPFRPSWGNYHHDSYGECGVPFSTRFVMPNNGYQNYWYSVDYPLVHLVTLSAEHDFLPGSDQHRWLVTDLNKVDRTKQWIIINMHRPLYTSAYYGPSQWAMLKNLKRYLEPVLYEYQVDLLISGHMHNYERTCPVHNQQCVGNNSMPLGTIHLTVGTAGFRMNFTKDIPTWSQFRLAELGYTSIRILNQHELEVSFIDTNGTVRDFAFIRRTLSPWAEYTPEFPFTLPNIPSCAQWLNISVFKYILMLSINLILW